MNSIERSDNLNQMFLKKHSYLFVIFSFSVCLSARGEHFDDAIATIKKRFFNIYMAEVKLIPNDSIANWKSTIREDGSWAIFNYKDTPKVNLPSLEHLYRLSKMSVAYNDSLSSFYKNPQLALAIKNGLNYWIDVAPRSQNWWYRVIGIPIEIAKVLILMETELSAFEKEKGIKILRSANVNGVLKTVTSEATGQNMIWIARLQMEAACLQNSKSYLQFSAEKIAREMRVVLGEGIQVDWSFHQHGPQLYSGGYGARFAIDCSELINVLHKTEFAFNDSLVYNISQLILVGQGWLVRGNKIDYGAAGREIARMDKTALTIATACDNMAKLNDSNATRFNNLAKDIRNAVSTNSKIAGNKYFWRSDFMVHRSAAYYTSVKMASNRVLGSESGNGEAELNYHLGDGCTYIMTTGKEYENIFPLWDWQKIPGTTVRLQKEPLPLITFGKGARGTTTFVGGVSDGKYGLAAFDYSKDSVTAYKSWFYFDKEFICLGAGISSVINGEVITGINQCFVNGNIHFSEINNNNKKLENSLTSGALSWVHHDSVAYIFEQPLAVNVEQQTKTASWKVINKALANARVENGKIFSLWLNHGNKPANDTYAYTVVPAIGLSDVQAYKDNKPYKIIANSSSLQAVQHDGLQLAQIAFWQKGKLMVFDSYEVQTDAPCLILINKKNNTLEISLASPENEKGTISIEIKTKLKTYNASFKMPSGEYLGKTIIQIIAI